SFYIALSIFFTFFTFLLNSTFLCSMFFPCTMLFRSLSYYHVLAMLCRIYFTSGGTIEITNRIRLLLRFSVLLPVFFTGITKRILPFLHPFSLFYRLLRHGHGLLHSYRIPLSSCCKFC